MGSHRLPLVIVDGAVGKESGGATVSSNKNFTARIAIAAAGHTRQIYWLPASKLVEQFIFSAVPAVNVKRVSMSR